MSPDRACQPIEWHIWKQCNANRSVGLTDRTAVRSANLKGKAARTSKVQTIIHKHILHIKGRNNPLEGTSRSSQPADRMDVRTDFQTNRTAHSIELLSDRMAYSIQVHCLLFPRYSSLCYRTIQANLFSVLPSIHDQPLWVYSIPFCFQHFWVLHT